jgi:hypothetical protein
MRQAVGGGRWKTLFVELHVTRSLFHGASNPGCKMFAASPTMMAVHCIKYDACPWYTGHALHPLSHSCSRAAGANQRLLLTSSLVFQPCGLLR